MHYYMNVLSLPSENVETLSEHHLGETSSVYSELRGATSAADGKYFLKSVISEGRLALSTADNVGALPPWMGPMGNWMGMDRSPSWICSGADPYVSPPRIISRRPGYQTSSHTALVSLNQGLWAEWLKDLPCKREDLGFRLQPPPKSQVGKVEPTWGPSIWESLGDNWLL